MLACGGLLGVLLPGALALERTGPYRPKVRLNLHSSWASASKKKSMMSGLLTTNSLLYSSWPAASREK